MTTSTAIHLSGILAIIGTCLYVIGDVLLLAVHVGPINQTATPLDVSAYPALQRRAESWANLAVLPWWRIVWGGLLGVFAAPLTLAGIWQVYQGLQPAGSWLALPPTLLFVYATVLGPFIHGSFIYLSEKVQLLNTAEENLRPRVAKGLIRLQTILFIGYGVLFACVIVASFWFAVAVAFGQTRFPLWMLVANPLVITLAWLAIKKILPKRIADFTEGAGFNIAYTIFFILTTVILW